jgi:hypothetical protein
MTGLVLGRFMHTCSNLVHRISPSDHLLNRSCFRIVKTYNCSLPAIMNQSVSPMRSISLSHPCQKRIPRLHLKSTKLSAVRSWDPHHEVDDIPTKLDEKHDFRLTFVNVSNRGQRRSCPDCVEEMACQTRNLAASLERLYTTEAIE